MSTSRIKNSAVLEAGIDKDNSKEGLIGLLNEMIIANSSETDVLTIYELREESDKGFFLAKSKKYEEAEKVFNLVNTKIQQAFTEDSFEYSCCQMLTIPGQSYLRFKTNNSDQAIFLMHESITYAIQIQSFKAPYNLGLYVSQMLTNLAQVYLSLGEVSKWKKITLENIHFLLNLTLPENCRDFKTYNLRKSAIRYIGLIDAISNSLIDTVRYRVKGGHEFIEAIEFNNTTEEIVATIQLWKKLNSCISEGTTNTEFFQAGYYNFLSLEAGIYELRILKLFLKNRVKKEEVQLS